MVAKQITTALSAVHGMERNVVQDQFDELNLAGLVAVTHLNYVSGLATYGWWKAGQREQLLFL